MIRSRRFGKVYRQNSTNFAPRNSKPPIREPNAIEKREKGEKEKDKKEKKKPVIRTDGSVDNSENRVAMEADDNPKGDPDAVFRYERGVKFAEEPAAKASDNDNLAEKGRRYVTKRLWGVSLKQPKPDVEDAASLTSENPGRGASERQNASPTVRIDEAKSNVSSALNSSAKEAKTTAEYLSTPSSNLVSPNDDLIAAERERIDASPSLNFEALRKIMSTSPNTLEEVITVDDEYNVPEGVSPDAEIAAWKNLFMKWKSIAVSQKQDFLPDDYIGNLKKVSIRPEAPQPKLDVRVVKSIEDSMKDKEIDSIKSMEIERSGFMDVQRSDSHSSNRKMHTLNMQIRYAHRNANFITRRNIELLPVSSTYVEKTIQMCPGSTSAFSTNSENQTSNQQSEKQRDSKSHEKKSDITTNSLNATGPLLSKECQTFSKINQKQSYVDSNLAKIRAIAEDKKTKISLNQSQVTEKSKDHEKTACLSNAVSAPLQSVQKDGSHFNNKNIQSKTKNSEDSYVYTNLQNESATYVAFDAPSTDNDRIESYAAKEDSKSNSKNEKNTTFDSDVEDVDDLSKDYIIDGDYVRLPGDPYPYSKEHLDKWRVPHSRSLVYKSIKREPSRSDSSFVARSSLRNVNDSYANAAAVPRDSHAGTVMETSGSGDSAKNAGRASGFHMSSRDQRVAPDYLRVDDAADTLGLRQWTQAFSRLGAADERTSQTARDGDNVSLHAYHQ
nr:PREDICTED: uncharacterized protein LOC105676946 [Linepithema humile]